MLERLIRIASALERALVAAIAVLMAGLSILVSWQVFSRYVLKASPYWTEEFSVVGMMWIGLLGAAACVWSGSHMSLELLVRRLPLGLRGALEVLADLAIAAFAGFLCIHGLQLAAATMSSIMATVPIPLGLTYVVIPAAAALMILFAALRAVRRLAVLRTEVARNGSHDA